MRFSEFIKSYLYWFIKITLLLLSIAIMVFPFPLAILLATFMNPASLWLVLLVFVSFPVGMYMLLKVIEY